MAGMENYIVLKFGIHRVVLFSPNGRGAEWTKHFEGHNTLAFDGCQVIGSVTVAENEDEPSLSELLARVRAVTYLDGVPSVKYLGTTLNGTQYRS